MPRRTQAILDFFAGIAIVNLAGSAADLGSARWWFLTACGALLIAIAFLEIRPSGRRPPP